MNKLIIVGSGPAGLTAAIYASRAQLEPLLFAGREFGGQLTTTTLVENYPGFVDGVMGPELMMNMAKQAERFGTKIIQEEVTAVKLEGEVKKVTTSDGKVYESEAVILATGASPRRLGVPGEDKFYGKGVSTCATCDAAFYKEKVVAVIGGGDTAMEEASFLTKFASKVYLVHRKNEFRAGKIMQERVTNNSKIEILWNTEVKEVLGQEKVSGIKVMNNQDNSEKELSVDGVFLAIGHIPNTKMLEGQIELNEKGYVKEVDHTIMQVDGVFIAGDLQDDRYRQAITAAGMGCMAAMDAERWFASKTK